MMRIMKRHLQNCINDGSYIFSVSSTVNYGITVIYGDVQIVTARTDCFTVEAKVDFRSTVNYGGTVIYGGSLSLVLCSSFAPHPQPVQLVSLQSCTFPPFELPNRT
ncbi:hypothetical protein HanPI659440_Chr01g0010711 [Helianthus annuus]|nr:hypothetical protein HanPI659440_Chr01g0010711 [Helianthus annuus]